MSLPLQWSFLLQSAGSVGHFGFVSMLIPKQDVAQNWFCMDNHNHKAHASDKHRWNISAVWGKIEQIYFYPFIIARVVTIILHWPNTAI